MKHIEMLAMRRISKANDCNCLDLGNVRIQWGTSPVSTNSVQTIALPKPFANISYALTTTVSDINIVLETADVTEKKTTSFVVVKRCINVNMVYGESKKNFDWIAIGLKP